jgi:hypothetical protein
LFGFLIKGEVAEDAVLLKTLVDQSMERYVHMEPEKLAERIATEFPDSHSIDDRSFNYVHSQAPQFLFMINRIVVSGDTHNLMVLGQRKYAGFALHADAKSRFCSVSDGIATRATAGAKSLARHVAKKYGYTDMSDRLAF